MDQIFEKSNLLNISASDDMSIFQTTNDFAILANKSASDDMSIYQTTNDFATDLQKNSFIIY